VIPITDVAMQSEQTIKGRSPRVKRSVTEKPPNFACIEAIRQIGFEGFVTIAALQVSKCSEVPTKPGVYLLLRSTTEPPDFLSESIGGAVQGEKPHGCGR
jgi:hypothetical protein